MNLSDAFSLIRQLQGALGGRTTRSGSGVVSWSASPLSSVAVVTHEMGHVPDEVFIQFHDTGAALFARPEVFSITDTTFSMQAKTESTTAANIPFFWHVFYRPS